MTYSLHTVTQEALFEELKKIAEAAPAEERKGILFKETDSERHARQAKLRKWFKITAATSLGIALVNSAAQEIEPRVAAKIGRGWNNLSDGSKMAILLPALAASTLAISKANKALTKKKNEFHG